MADFTIEAKLVFNAAEANAEMQATQAQMRKMEALGAAASTSLNAVKYSTLTGIGALAALIAPTVIATKVLATFDDNLRRISAIGGTEFSKNMGKTIETINEMSVAFGSTAADITEVIITYAKAGFTYNETMKMLEPTLQLAVANQAELAETSELAMYAYSLWGRKIGMDTYEMLDKMHRAANLSIMDIEDLSDAFNMAGSAASIAGISYEEFLAIAGGLSMVGAEAGSQLGTLITRMITSGKELEEALEISGVVEDGVVSMETLVSLMREGRITQDNWNKAFALWGVKSARPLMQMSQAADYIEDIYLNLTGGVDTLKTGVEEMSVSFKRLQTSLIEALWSGIRTKENMDALRIALSSLLDYIKNSNIGTALTGIVLSSAQFITRYGETLVNMLSNLSATVVKLYPTIYQIGEMFVNLANFIAKIPAPLMKMIALFMITNKIIPITNVIIPALIRNMGTLTLTTNLTSLSINKYVANIQAASYSTTMFLASVAVLGMGMGFLTTATTDWDIALGVLMVTIGAIIPMMRMFTMLSAVITAFENPIYALAAAGAAAAALGIVSGAIAYYGRDREAENIGSTSYGDTYNINNYNYDAALREIPDSDYLGGTMEGTR